MGVESRLTTTTDPSGIAAVASWTSGATAGAANKLAFGVQPSNRAAAA
ncbi:MAG: hypothetical protein WCP98_08465 [Actinomycetes bacterium]